jgi:succinoglycan biosynthesis protein ExoM
LVEVSICIATRVRPAGLETLLTSLAAQRGAPAFDVIVIDNDPAGSARIMADRFAGRLAITYAIEPVPGVSSARNRGVAMAKAPLLAFIDDDERAEPDWLAALHAKMVDPAVGGAIGTVRFEFAADVARYRRNCGLYDGLDLADGEKLEWWGTWIGNSIIRRTSLPAPPFDPALNLVGGEDSHLFARMIADGANIVAARQAITHEFRSAERMRLANLLGRALRGGATDVEIDWQKRRIRARARYGVKSAVLCALNLPLALICWLPDRAFALRRLMAAVSYAGRLGRLLGWRYREYASGSPPELATPSHVDAGKPGDLAASPHDVYLAPHCDDIAFSLGHFAKARAQGRLITVFTRSNYTAQPGLAGLPVEQVTERRRAEESRFARACGLALDHFSLPEAPLRGQLPMDHSRAEQELPALMPMILPRLLALGEPQAAHDRPWLFAPVTMGGHLDHALLLHIIARSRDALTQRFRLAFYEDLPYAAWIAQREEGLARLHALLGERGWRRIAFPLGDAIAGKLDLIGLYESQLAEPPTIARFSPEVEPSAGPHEAIWVNDRL